MGVIDDIFKPFRDGHSPQPPAPRRNQNEPGFGGNMVRAAVEVGQSVAQAQETAELMGQENRDLHRSDIERRIALQARENELTRKAEEMRRQIDQWEADKKLDALRDVYRDY